ncbi:hypothetical protein [Iningainema tapete]|uniref:Uncharacterized protein n=1 Tax=Iningainema tapete BLCC-T55 TaxID=2748662 RepID=A0A8J6XQX1_9CYAN|nr:hypothetical protein [Iningainema tapete]MBD2771883.1 hypothetical protein [Iningainema tapete BLCC-T55]
MHPYTCNLVTLVIALCSASIISPSFAQNLEESNKENTISISSSSSNFNEDTIPSNLSKSDFTDDKSVIISDADNQVSTTNVAATKPNPRIPIPSRIFAAPSMQQ